MRINVDVTNPELDALEDLLICWNLCDKHNRDMSLKTEVDKYKVSITCKDCLKAEGKLRNKALKLWSKLVTAYEKARK